MSIAFPPVIRDDLPELIEPLADCVDRLEHKTILITGAAGFLGGYLADALAFLNETRPAERRWKLLLLARSEEGLRRRLPHLIDFDAGPDSADVTEELPRDERAGLRPARCVTGVASGLSARPGRLS